MSDSEWASYDIQWSKKPGQKPPTLLQVFGSLAKWIGLVALTVGLFVGFWVFVGSMWLRASQQVQQKMISDAVQQYKIVEQGNDLYAKHIQAAVVAEAFLMAKDSENYHKWKQISEGWDTAFKKQIEADTIRQFQRLSR